MWRQPPFAAALLLIALLLIVFASVMHEKKINLESKYIDNGYCQYVDHLGNYTWKKCECNDRK